MLEQEVLKSKIGPKLAGLGRLARTLAIQRFAEAEYEITPEQFTVLSVLMENDGLYQRQIAKITLKDRPNITRILKILESMELITKKQDVNKRKIYKIYITEKGKATYKKILPTICDLWKLHLHGLTNEELQTCLKALDVFRANLEKAVNIQF